MIMMHLHMHVDTTTTFEMVMGTNRMWRILSQIGIARMDDDTSSRLRMVRGWWAAVVGIWRGWVAQVVYLGWWWCCY